MNFCVKSFIDYMCKNNYYIIMIVEDLINYYNFDVVQDIVYKDVRNIELSNSKYGIMIIQSKIISSNPHIQYNKITYKKYSSDFLNFTTNNNWTYYGKCYTKK